MEVRVVGVGELRPVGPAVGGLEDAGAAHGVGIEHAFAGAGVEDAGIVRVHGQDAHGQVGDEVGERGPGGAAVSGLPDAARHPGGVHGVGRAGVNHQAAGAPADVAGAERRPAPERESAGPAAVFRLRQRRQELSPGGRVARHPPHVLERLQVFLRMQDLFAGRGALEDVELLGLGGLVVGPGPLLHLFQLAGELGEQELAGRGIDGGGPALGEQERPQTEQQRKPEKGASGGSCDHAGLLLPARQEPGRELAALRGKPDCFKVAARGRAVKGLTRRRGAC